MSKFDDRVAGFFHGEEPLIKGPGLFVTSVGIVCIVVSYIVWGFLDPGYALSYTGEVVWWPGLAFLELVLLGFFISFQGVANILLKVRKSSATVFMQLSLLTWIAMLIVFLLFSFTGNLLRWSS